MAGDPRRYHEPEFVDDVGGEQRRATEILAWTPTSPPRCRLRSRTNSTRPPSSAVALAQSRSRGVDVATYFVTPLMNVANGWIWLLGQNCAHSV